MFKANKRAYRLGGTTADSRCTGGAADDADDAAVAPFGAAAVAPFDVSFICLSLSSSLEDENVGRVALFVNRAHYNMKT